MLGALRTLVGLCAYGMSGAATPQDVELLRDPARLAGLHEKLNGRDGSAGATQRVLENRQVTGTKERPAEAGEDRRFVLNYRWGERGDKVVLLASSGARVERPRAASLKFLNSVCPRQGP